MAKNKKVAAKKKNNEITTIKLDRKTKNRLEHLREHKETYNEIINKALNILNICLKKPLLANKILRDIERSKKMSSLIENPDKILRRKNIFEEHDDVEDYKTNINKIQSRPEALNHIQREISIQRPIPMQKIQPINRQNIKPVLRPIVKFDMREA